MNVLGIDPASSSIALTAIWEEEALVGKYKLGAPYTPQNPTQAYNAVNTFLSRLIHGKDSSSLPTLVCLEEPVAAYGRVNIGSVIKQAQVNGAIQVALGEWELAYFVDREWGLEERLGDRWTGFKTRNQTMART